MYHIEVPVCNLHGKKVLLINPPWNLQSGNIWKNVASCYPSLGLGMIASYLEHCNAKVKIIDMQAVPGDESLLKNIEQPDFIGITATTVIINEAYSVAKMIRRVWNDVKIVIGGVHATIAPKEILSMPFIDYVIRGEGERSFAKLIGGFSFDNIQGLAMIQNGIYWEHSEMDFIEDLNKMPLPAYHLLPMSKYRPPLGGALHNHSISIFSSRGCPGQCTYCNSAVTKKLRFRNPENVVSEIKHLIERYDIKEIGFYDDTFCASPKRVKDICKLLIKENINITWTCMSRINYADQETLILMAKAGCHMICYGVESADKQILKNIKKGIKLETVKNVVLMTQGVGIRTRLSFMFGNPGETIETMNKTLQFAIETDPDLVQFNITTPYPGTEMYQWAKKKGYLLTENWSEYDLYNVVMDLPTVTPDQIKKFYHYAYRKFFLRFGFFKRFIFNIVKNPLLFKNSVIESFILFKKIITRVKNYV